jgi:hypothetical protein
MRRAFLTCLVVMSEIAFAAVPEPEQLQPVAARDYPRSQLRNLADQIDQLFGTERDDENKSESTLRLIANNKWNEGSPNETEFDARFMLKLATLQRWEKSVQDWINERMLHLKNKLAPANADQTGQEVLEPGGTNAKPDPWRFTIEHKVKIALQNQYEAQAILSRDFEGHVFLHHFESNLGWSIENLWDAQSRVISKRSLSEKLLFQFSNSASWQISQKTFSTSHGPSLTYMLASNQAVSISLNLAASVIGRVWAAQTYAIATSYRLQAYGDWIFFSFNPYLAYARENRFYRNPGFTANLEFVF